MTSANWSEPAGGGPADTVGLIGLGPMGAPIAGHIADAGYRLRVWNRTRETAEQLRPHAEVADGVERLSSRVILSALPDIDHLDRLTPSSVLEQWQHDGTARLIVLSTTSPDKVRALAARVAPFDITVVDAAMSGGDAGATAGTLSLMVGADRETFGDLLPLLRTFATTIENMGPLGTGAAAKLCNQLVVAGTLVSLAEALHLARKSGLSDSQLARVLKGGLASSAVLDLKADKLLGRTYELGGSAVNQLKDLRYAVALGDDVGARLPLARESAALFEEAVNQGLGGHDHAVIQEVLEAPQLHHTNQNRISSP
ncbi:NAD(P)-dependent oxidoreductase [Paenarthrobacter sp. NPDC090522]|uniref:NAD(P)-dependent oxidoreductase n=1 Tax=Paenarthrobacter sp. NPDC090522 TaxID=3364383 RepID=UPI0037F82F5C